MPTYSKDVSISNSVCKNTIHRFPTPFLIKHPLNSLFSKRSFESRWADWLKTSVSLLQTARVLMLDSKLCQQYLFVLHSVYLQPGCVKWTLERRWEWRLPRTAVPPVTEGRSPAAARPDATRRPAAWAPRRPAAPRSTSRCRSSLTDGKKVVVSGANGHATCVMTRWHSCISRFPQH